jgi:stage III sporulation protein SpoIIIAA
MLESLIPSERKADRMLNLYHEEAAVRGSNVYALYSAMTNYSTYADDRNGFSLRNTGHDTQAVSMWNREHEVSKWVSSNQFAQLVAA